MCLSKFFGTSKPSYPSDWVKAEAIKYQDGILTIDLRPPMLNVPVSKPPIIWWPEIPDTGSMLPVFGKGNNNFLAQWENPTDQKAALDFAKEGDIAVYRTARLYAIHRIKQKILGLVRKWKFRGDNNPVDDPDTPTDSEMQWFALGQLN